VARVAEVVARERGTTVDRLAADVTANFDRLFGPANRPQSPALQ